MPELPEVEITLQAIRPVLEGRRIARMTIRHHGLRWPVPPSLPARLAGQTAHCVRRRGKYLLVEIGGGTLLVHLGMSGSIRLLPREAAPGPHDHIDIMTVDGRVLRYTDPRRFGAFLWIDGDPTRHKLLRVLGPEPWDPDLTAASLRARAAGHKRPVKSFIMDNGVLVGVGNIYASESLFRARIHPKRPVGRISTAAWTRLLRAIREVLEEAIRAGGTTLRDFSSGDGRPGYFARQLAVYGRGGEPCPRCAVRLLEIRIGGRTSVYCGRCQR